MKLFDVVIEIVIEHPIFGIALAFLIGALLFLLLGHSGWAIACFVGAAIFSLVALFLGQGKHN